jgi:hypothetical protein
MASAINIKRPRARFGNCLVIARWLCGRKLSLLFFYGGKVNKTAGAGKQIHPFAVKLTRANIASPGICPLLSAIRLPNFVAPRV